MLCVGVWKINFHNFHIHTNTHKKAVSKCDLIPFISFFLIFVRVVYCVCVNNACILSSLPQTSCRIFLHYYHIILLNGRAKKRNEVEKEEEEEVQNSNLLNALKHLIINLMNNEETEASSSCKFKATSLIYQSCLLFLGICKFFVLWKFDYESVSSRGGRRIIWENQIKVIK